MGWVVRVTPRPLYPRERPGTHCTGGWVGPRASLDGCGKYRPHRHSIPEPSSPWPVAISTELSRPLQISLTWPNYRFKNSEIWYLRQVEGNILLDLIVNDICLLLSTRNFMVVALKLSYPPPKIVNHPVLANHAGIRATLKPPASLDYFGISRCQQCCRFEIPAVFEVKWWRSGIRSVRTDSH
jgi:hypothetical protein